MAVANTGLRKEAILAVGHKLAEERRMGQAGRRHTRVEVHTQVRRNRQEAAHTGVRRSQVAARSRGGTAGHRLEAAERHSEEDRSQEGAVVVATCSDYNHDRTSWAVLHYNHKDNSRSNSSSSRSR